MVYKHIAATSTVVLSPAGHCNLASVTVNTAAASAVLKIYDGQDATGTLVASIDASAVGQYWFAGARLSGGLTVVLSGGNADCTIVFG